MTAGTTSGERAVTLDISLLGREYKVSCKEDERAELVEAVALLDRRMRDIRDSGKIAGTERIAVMAALNLAHDLLRERKNAAGSIDAEAARRRISGMQSAIDEVLGEQEKLF
jgi:cell division protein ZapA